MNDTTNSPVCERAPDLVAFLYHEMNERETREFERHLQQCAGCREELASFGLVRESITAWRDEALSGFVSTPVMAKQQGKSALAALRQFVDLSPLWLKAATAFAVIAFCVLAGSLFVSLKKEQPVAGKSDAVYTQQDVDRLVKEALIKDATSREALATQAKPSEEKAPKIIVASEPASRRTKSLRQAPGDRRPLSRAEREQLAADLRLLTTDDDELDLIGDRINR